MKDIQRKNSPFPVKLDPLWRQFALDVNSFFQKHYPSYLFDAFRVIVSIFHILREKNIADPDRVQTIASKMRGFLYPIFSGQDEIKKHSGIGVKVLRIALSITKKNLSKNERLDITEKLERLRELDSKNN